MTDNFENKTVDPYLFGKEGIKHFYKAFHVVCIIRKVAR